MHLVAFCKTIGKMKHNAKCSFSFSLTVQVMRSQSGYTGGLDFIVFNSNTGDHGACQSVTQELVS